MLLALKVVFISTPESCVQATNAADTVGLHVLFTARCIVVASKINNLSAASACKLNIQSLEFCF